MRKDHQVIFLCITEQAPSDGSEHQLLTFMIGVLVIGVGFNEEEKNLTDLGALMWEHQVPVFVSIRDCFKFYMLKKNTSVSELFHMIKERFKIKRNYANFSKMERLGKKINFCDSSLQVTCLLYQLQIVCLEYHW